MHFASTIWGDEFLADDDVLFGGLCVQTPSKLSRLANGYRC